MGEESGEVESGGEGAGDALTGGWMDGREGVSGYTGDCTGIYLI